MRLILNRQVKVAGVRLATGADVTDLSKDYRASIEHQGWADWKHPVEVVEAKRGEPVDLPRGFSPVQQPPQPEVKEENKPVEQVAKPVQRPQRKPKK